ncbi:MAG TPA: YebC/PmpR family DNA-binding transcriptional regulator [Dehalococcoidia bacterium]|nr:YebC/PmpR family DNA-binding transcriptional regulator [Dehalococcoidia bacterium]
MGGHSHWSQIKRQKGSSDVKRGALFTKLSREITVAAREGGGDPDMNPRLRLAIEKAREGNMPADTIDRAVKRGSGAEGDAVQLQEARFEGYGPNGVAIMVDALTDNRNRTVAELRTALTRGGGSLGETGCVGWLFDSRGVLTIPIDTHDPDELALASIDAGAADVEVVGEQVEVYTAPTELDRVRKALLEQGIPVQSAELTALPKSSVALDDKTAGQVLRLLDTLEDLDDIQHVYSNADFPEAVLLDYAGR